MHQLQTSWYQPGNWSLPGWWTDVPPSRDFKTTYQQQKDFYNSAFVVNVLGHKGGITTLPRSDYGDLPSRNS